MRYVTGDECGLIKEFLPSSRPKKEAGDIRNKDGTSSGGPSGIITEQGIRRINAADRMARTNAVVGLAWMKTGGDPDKTDSICMASLRIDGSVQVWQGQHEQKPHANYRQLVNLNLPTIFGEHGKERALGLQELGTINSRLCACSTSGTIVVMDPLLSQETNGIVEKFTAYESSKNSKDLANTVTAFCAQPTTGLLAVGGKDRETVVWDTAGDNSKMLWKAKNLPPDPQTLLQPQVWPTAACFMNVGGSSDSNLLAVGTAYRQVRIYDIRMGGGVAGTVTQHQQQQRRPISYTPIDESSVFEHRITALCPITEFELAVGDAGGYIHAIDLRRLSGGPLAQRDARQSVAAVVGRFVGPAGSVRQLVRHENRIACVGLDRMLRIYDTKTRKQLHTVYLKQRLNCVLISSDAADFNSEDNEDDGDIDQEDNVQDYVDSDSDSFEDEDDVVEEMIDQMGNADEDEDDESESSEDAPAAPRTKRRRQ